MSPSLLGPLPEAPVTRFAPSPTGYLHLGHVANAVWTWGIAGVSGAKIVLRIEDHDRGRCRPEYERAIRDDLDWLGLRADSMSRQSDTPEIYQSSLEALARRHAVYGCRCSRADIARQLAADGLEEWDELRYPGTCRELGLGSSGLGVRVELPEDDIEFTDLLQGPSRQRPARQCGDLLLRDVTGGWTYQFSVVVDDLRQGVNLVIRGEDLLPSTGRQIMLAAMLGSAGPPAFLHHPLIRSPEGIKLSKRAHATGIRELRAEGWSPARVLGEAAYRTGLLLTARELRPEDLGSLFTA